MDNDRGAEAAARASEGNNAIAWLSRGFEQLVYDNAHPKKGSSPDEPPFRYDVVIVGSGYGGAIAAAQLAGSTQDGKPITLCVLERGKEYLSGMFPSRMADLPGHIRFSTPNASAPRGMREGLFDFRVGPDVCALVANGLGGGSLINAGVMAQPANNVFTNRWPQAFRVPQKRKLLYRKARRLLGALDNGKHNTVLGHRRGAPQKFQALKNLAGGSIYAAPISIAMKDKPNSAGVALKACNFCGDCATGCNHHAKDSLDVNQLFKAWQRGAEIYVGATVLRIERDPRGTGWVLIVVHTDDKLRRKERTPLRLRAKRIILAAGSFGSTEILLRSQSDTLKFSPCLGQGFSTNGDMIAAVYHQNARVNAVADECCPPSHRGVGPTITGIASGQNGCVFEDLAIPGALRRAFEEIVTTSATLYRLTQRDDQPHESKRPPAQDPCAIDPRAIRRTSVLAVMGNDGTKGSLELLGGSGEDDGDGALRVRWSELADADLFRSQMSVLRSLAGSPKVKGQVFPHPLWQLLPDDLQKMLMKDKRGPLFTVHPLGGCAMATDFTEGAVDWAGRVFDPSNRAIYPSIPHDKRKPYYEGLVVLDGSIVPGSLGMNPALTIAALALCAVAELRREWAIKGPGLRRARAFRREWKLKRTRPPGPFGDERPDFRPPPPAVTPGDTVVEFTERMAGPAMLRTRSNLPMQCVIELTLDFRSCPLAPLVRSTDQKTPVALERRLEVLPSSRLRIFQKGVWDAWQELDARDEESQGLAIFCAPLMGELTFLHREPTTCKQRIATAKCAWLRNRGVRDGWQDKGFWKVVGVAVAWIFRRCLRWFGRTRIGKFTRPLWARSPHDMGTPDSDSLADRFLQAISLASRAGEIRLFDYGLNVGQPTSCCECFDPKGFTAQQPTERNVRGRKRLTYAKRSNPWRQLSEMTLCAFPGLWRPMFPWPGQVQPPVLKLDTKYLAAKKIPLMRILSEHDGPSSLADVASFLGYFLRLLLSIHMWSFRRPDPPAPREPQRLPGKIRIHSGFAWLRRRRSFCDPETKELDVDQLPDGTPVKVRLTRYRHRDTDRERPPVVMVHGYSASGTTFAHRAVNPNLAQHFCRLNRDVWVLDLRTSSAMPTARQPWALEDAALADLPAALHYIHLQTDRQLDIIAHCMGAAMFSMAVLAPRKPGEKFLSEREELPRCIRRAVLSQIGPVMVMSPANVFRGYAMSYLRRYLPLGGYDFRVKSDPGLVDQLIDRLLATLPYPEEEFDIENPPWIPRRTPFAGTRHRMDALYGRSFSLADSRGRPRLARGVLKHIDDLFGPLSADTVSQVIHFARMKVVANRTGSNPFVSRMNLAGRWKFPTLSIHGTCNGLSDVATLQRMLTILRDDAGCPIEVTPLADFGHQDSLIAKDAGKVFNMISSFLEREETCRGAKQAS